MAPARFECTLCDKNFTRRFALDRHIRTIHGGESSKCGFCGQNFNRKDNYLRHLKSNHQQGGGPVEEVNDNKTNGTVDVEKQADDPSSENDKDLDCITEEDAINGNLRKYSIEGKGKFIFDPLSYLKSKEDEIRSILRREVLRKHIKYYLTMQVRFKKQKGDAIETTEPYFVHGAQRTEVPSEENKWLQYEEVKKQLKVPYVVYADFESILEQQYGCQPDPSKASTIKLARHVPSGFTYKVVGINEELTEDHVTYRGPDTIKVFMDHMVNLEERLIKVMNNPKPLQMTDDDHRVFREATHCHICGEMLNHDRVRDHCHITGKFRGATHNDCNLKFQLTKRIPVVFHNLRGYDAHHIMSEIGKMKRKNLKCIPQNHEKYISFSLGNLDFLDTFQFMSTSLQKLVENLAKKGISKFSHLKSYVETTHPENQNIKVQLLTRKGVYPYRYLDSFERFNEASLPDKSAFYNDLEGKDIPEAEYIHAEKVWDIFKTKNLGEYHDLYMESDVHLLADVFENFRDLYLEIHGLDAAHFYTAAGLAWQAALKMTSVQLELLTDPDMHLFIEKGLRGGIAMISKRYAKANNPHLSDYDPKKESSDLLYLDANNLYGWGMSQFLPTHRFE
ncbi:hypothetical protein FSP39_004239 [Pinctada imbricata]|uniref:C2H2-type domain-containing protein n=1 Tax=Pinctada imbricata TaxID=66713 RepID=A0AA88YGZ9_PINIB|nr:hypothetical protein FSP39_004239 [Pinctada imbricata]